MSAETSESKGKNRLTSFPIVCLIYAGILLLIDLLFVSLISFFLSTPFFLSGILFVEGGIILTVGGFVDMSSSPPFAKFKEVMYKTPAWTPEYQKRNQKKALEIIVTGIIIIIFSILFS